MTVLSRIRGLIYKGTLEIIPHVHQLTIRGVNLILITEDEMTLIDTAFRGSSAQIVDFIHRLGRSPEEITLIIITHNHFDHVGGLSELKRLTRAKVAIHKSDIGGTERQLFYPRTIRRILRIPPFSAFRPAFSINPEDADLQLEGGELLKPLGGLKVIHTPGHTPGSISLFSPKNRLLIVGDALDKYHQTVLPPHKSISSDMSQANASVKRIARLDFDTLCFGHGQSLRGDIHAKVQKLAESIHD
ncbi:MAG: MBL fold metallo-hydrolase [Dehalococcoidales bacterium]|nr:MBL fold metallo-hydrolase [Dehalococcoidales bacterium]